MSTKLKIDIGNVKLDVEGGDLVVLEIYKDFKASLMSKLDKIDLKTEYKSRPVSEPVSAVKMDADNDYIEAIKPISQETEKTIQQNHMEEAKPVKVPPYDPNRFKKSNKQANNKNLSFKEFLSFYKHETVYDQLLVAVYYFYLNGQKKFTRINYIDLLKKNGLHTKSTRNSCGYSLGMLQKKKLITKIDRGIYEILPNAVEAAKEMQN